MIKDGMTLHKYDIMVLRVLHENGSASLDELVERTSLKRDEVLWAIENLGKNGYAEVERSARSEVVLTDEGSRYAADTLPENRLLRMLESKTVRASSLSGAQDQIGLAWAKKKGYVSIEGGTVMLTEKGVKVIGEGSADERMLKALAGNPDSYGRVRKEHPEEMAALVRRKLVMVRERSEITRIRITEKGKKALRESKEDEEVIDALSKNIIVNKLWTGKKFKAYDVGIHTGKDIAARRHPLRRLMEEVRLAYLGNGFREISGPMIDSAFWNFDSLFVPQDHPARDAQDTFYLSNPERIDLDDNKYVRKVSKAHEKAWHEAWDLDAARQAVLRTHTTSTTSRYIYQIIENIISTKSRSILPIKLFSIGRIFRNENIDYRHLADFYQHDGIIIGENLALSNLFDTLINIHRSLGVEVKFKPSYFPFVEPGVEIFAYSQGKQEWIEMGGSGLIRKEITGAASKNIGVLAWGLGLERILLIRDRKLESIAQLYNNDIGWLRKMPI